MRSKYKLIWIDLIGCNGCTHSFFNHPSFSSFLDNFEVLYHPILPTEKFRIRESDILIVEGAFRKNTEKLGFNLEEMLEGLIEKTKHIIAFGTCASFGGIFGEGLNYLKERKIRNYDLINVPGCPPHPEWLMYVLNMIRKNKKIVLDEFYRPVEMFGYTSHSGCIRNEYFEWKIDAVKLGTKEGCLFYFFGCQGPYTHSSCNKILWNEVSSKPRAGVPCFGCTEPSFPKENLFKTETFMGIPANIPLGASKRAYLTLSGIAKSLKNERLEKKIIRLCDENKSENNK